MERENALGQDMMSSQNECGIHNVPPSHVQFAKREHFHWTTTYTSFGSCDTCWRYSWSKADETSKEMMVCDGTTD